MSSAAFKSTYSHLSTRQLAALLQLSPITLRAYVRAGVIPCVKVGPHYRFSLADVNHVLKQRRRAPRRCFSCGAKTILRRFAALDGRGDPAEVTLRQCVECGALRLPKSARKAAFVETPPLTADAAAV